MTIIHNQEDRQLLQLFEANRNEGLKEIYRKYNNLALAQAYEKLNNYNDAEDIAQEVFKKMFERINSLDFNTSVKAYVIIAVKNACIDKIRKDERHKTYSADNIDRISDEHQKIYSLEEWMEAKERAKDVRVSVESLPEKESIIIKLIYYYNWSLEKAAKITGIPLNTIRKRLQTGRKKLRPKLKKHSPKD